MAMWDLGCDFTSDVTQPEIHFSPHGWQLVVPSCLVVIIWLQIKVGIIQVENRSALISSSLALEQLKPGVKPYLSFIITESFPSKGIYVNK